MISRSATEHKLGIQPRVLRLPESDARNVEDALRSLGREIAQVVARHDPEEIGRALLAREQLQSTILGPGVALPHCRLAGLFEPIVAWRVYSRGVDFGGKEAPALVWLAIVIVSPIEAPGVHLNLLARVARGLGNCAARNAEEARDLARKLESGFEKEGDGRES